MTITELENKVTELAAKYYKLIGPNHHKDRDFHFYIETVSHEMGWHYGEKTEGFKPKFKVCHYGYVNTLQEKYDCPEEEIDFDSYEEALLFLIENLERFVKGEI